MSHWIGVTPTLLLVVAHLYNPVELSNPQPYGKCDYSFQIWKPDEDAIRRIRDVEYKCSDVTVQVERVMGRTKESVAKEMAQTRNATSYMEKALLQSKLDHAQLRLEVKDVSLQLTQVRTHQERITNRMSLPVGIHRGMKVRHTGNGGYRDLKDEMHGVNKRMNVLQNGVGDLKAEWLLMKRDVTGITSYTSTLSDEQSDLKDKTAKLTSVVQDVQSDTASLKKQHKELQTLNGNLRKTIVDLRNENVRLRDGQTDVRVEGLKFHQDLIEIREQNQRLEQELKSILRHNNQLKHDVVAVALRSANMTQTEIETWLRSLPKAPSSENPVIHGPRVAPRDCHDVYNRGFHTSGVYQIRPIGGAVLDNVYCEMINQTGWTLIQRRVDGAMSFNRRWMEYKYGFGNLYSEFWLGNEVLHLLTSQSRYTLRVDMWDWEGHRAYAEYDRFKVDDFSLHYKIHVSGFSGNAGDSLSVHDNVYFSTEDMDNDQSRKNCAAQYGGGWWYNSCYYANPNGMYRTGWYVKPSHAIADGIVWYTLKDSDGYSLKQIELKVRPTHVG